MEQEDNQQVFECLENTLSQNTTINQYQIHNIIQDLKIWSIHISSLISNTTELIMKSNITYTSKRLEIKTEPQYK